MSRSAGALDESAALLGSAFVDDPVMRYYFEGPRDRAALVRKTMRLAAGLTLRHGNAIRLEAEAGLVGVALLLPPAVPDFPLSAILGAVLRTPALWRPRGLSRYFGVASSVGAHRPAFPCWTLVSLGVAPSMQHRGHGTRLLAEVLQGLPAGAPVFLETYNPRNLPFYGRQGFELTHEFVSHHGKGPRAWTLLRGGGLPTARSGHGGSG
jgi:GNAT superfamily N-acetyltransferase